MPSCLLIEDNEVNQLITRTMLQKLGCEVHTVSSVEEARPLLEATCYDIMLLDWHLPGMSGIDFLKLLRSTEKGKYMVVFIYSGIEDERGIKEALSAGADAFIPKTISIDKLEKQLKKLRII